jgi:two-component system, NtrC family, response regulator AtoC
MKFPGEQSFELPPDSAVFGTSEAMRKVKRDLSMIASTDVPVLIQGPSGTGKEIIAKMIHRQSSLAKGPFIKVNCPAIPDALLESELFGYEKGAFTGANASKPGLIAMANHGTLFLDEIGELSMPLQSKLLQVLQDGKFCRIGAHEETYSEARVICASSRDLKHEIEVGNFREDLYYRINVVNVSLPALRERSADIPELVEFFREHFNMLYNRRTAPISASLTRLLQAYHWPGNIRQLENMMKRYVILGTETCISNDLAEPAPPSLELDIPDQGPVPLKKITQQAVRRLERQVILKVLQNTHWNRRRAAETLKISYRALLYKIRDAGLSPARPAVPVREGSAEVLPMPKIGHADESKSDENDEIEPMISMAEGKHA